MATSPWGTTRCTRSPPFSNARNAKERPRAARDGSASSGTSGWWFQMFRLRDREMSRAILDKLENMNLKLTLMHVCGTHQDTLIRFGLDTEFQRVGVDIRQGPGCPVCVTPPGEIEEVLALARAGLTITAFGDVMKVPGENGSLNDVEAEGADVHIVFGVDDAVALARKTGKEVVFMGIGVETTAPTIASALMSDPPPNFS